MYFALSITLPEDAVEIVQGLLDGTEPAGIEIRDRTLKPPPGAPPLPEGCAVVRAFYDGEDAAREALGLVQSEFPDALVRCDPIQEENWAESWKVHVKPVRVGRVWVGPPWCLEQAGDAQVKIVIEPGMAFGTGDHPTTAMCLGGLDELLARRPGASVLDVGTGSGVLAIAARKLGAGRVAGNDVDPQAVRIARENAASNGAEDLELLDKPVERIAGTFDVVVANLFANVLCQLAPRLAARTVPGGELLLSGILTEQADEVLQAHEREGLKLRARRDTGEWVLLWLERP